MEEQLKLEDLEKYETLRSLIESRGNEIIWYKQKNDLSFQNSYGTSGSVESFEIYNNEITYTIYESWAYGGYDRYTVTISNELLCSDNWLEILSKETEENNKIFLDKKAKVERDVKATKLAEAKKLVKELSKK